MYTPAGVRIVAMKLGLTVVVVVVVAAIGGWKDCEVYSELQHGRW